MLTFKELKAHCSSDLHRYEGNSDKMSFLRAYIFIPGFKYMFHMRLCDYLYGKNALFRPLYVVSRLILSHHKYKYGISIHFKTNIGKGFFIGNFGNIFVSPKAVIGDNCSIIQGVTIGGKNRGKHMGSPVIGDGVYIGSGAKVIGAVKVGNNVAIGSNCVVTKDIPDDAVVVGVPGKVISYEGAKDYVINVDYPSPEQ